MSSSVSPLTGYIVAIDRLSAVIDRALAAGRAAEHQHDRLLALRPTVRPGSIETYLETLPPGLRQMFRRSLELTDAAYTELRAPFARPHKLSSARAPRAIRDRI